MKKISFLLAALALLFAAAGCKSNITNLREQINPTYHDIIVEADENAAYNAAVSALSQMGYNITSSGAARKRIEAIGAISNSGMSRPARQISVSVRVGVAPNNSSNIQVIFTEITEDKTSGRGGMGTKQPLSDSTLYSAFSKYVNEALAAK